MTYRTAALGIGAFFVVCAFISLLVAITTNYWIIIQVNRDSLGIGSTSSDTLAAFTRNRGIFRECFKDTQATRDYVRANYFVDEARQCLRHEFAQTRDVTYSTQYTIRTNLQIAMVIFFCLALLLCVCGFGVFCYSVSLSEHQYTKRWTLSTKWAGILIFVAAFCNALGMAFYHGAEYLETQKVGAENEEQSVEAPYMFYFTKDQPTALQNATSRNYSWSYALSWLAVFFEVMGAICLFLCGACCAPSRRSEKEFFDVNTLNSTRSYGQRNLAYEYMEGKQPVAIYEAQPPHMISDGVYHDHFQGRHFNPYGKGPVNQESRAQYNYDEGGWNWQ